MLAIRWFENNFIELNTDKCCLIVSGYKHEQVCTNIETDLIWESNDVKLLVVTIDRDLKFDKHVLKLFSKANQKLSALSRVAYLLSFNKRTFFIAFVESQFKNCPIVWMFHSRCTMEKYFCNHQITQRLLIEINRALHDISGKFERIISEKRKYH